MKKIEITQDEINTQLQDPTQCPFCGADSIDNYDNDFGSPILECYIHCDNCGAGWTQVYQIQTIKDYIPGSESTAELYE